MSKLEDDLLQYDKNTDLQIKTIEYDPNGNPNSRVAEERAEREDLSVVYPKPNELFVDIDNEHSYQLFIKQMDIMRKYVGATAMSVSPSKSGLPKRHIIVTLTKNVTEIERVALQAMIGSDRVRELLGYIQAKNNDPHPTLFLEKRQCV